MGHKNDVLIHFFKLTGTVKIKGELFISYKLVEKMESINQFGTVVRSLINARENGRSRACHLGDLV
jgi:hypothetical protein